MTRFLPIAVTLGIWMVVALIDTTQIHLRLSTSDPEITWLSLFGFFAAYWAGWAAVTPGIIWLGHRHSLERDRRARGLLLHALAACVTAVVLIAWYALLIIVVEVEGQVEFWPAFRRYMSLGFVQDVLLYFAVLGVGWGIRYRRMFEDQSVRASLLETRTAEAELIALRAQIQPHFLFNTLNAVSALIGSDAAQARRLIARLGDIFRLLLDGHGRQEVSVAREMELVDVYLEIELTRLGDRLEVLRDIDPTILDDAIPALSIQPLVENAIRHGASRRDSSIVEIHAQPDGEWLEISVLDQGPGLSGKGGETTGVAVANIRHRLEMLHGSRGRLIVEDRPEGGVVSRLRLPRTTLEDESSQ